MAIKQFYGVLVVNVNKSSERSFIKNSVANKNVNVSKIRIFSVILVYELKTTQPTKKNHTSLVETSKIKTYF